MLFLHEMIPRRGDLQIGEQQSFSETYRTILLLLLLWQCKINAPLFCRGHCYEEATKDNPFIRHPKVVTIFVSGVVREVARMARVD